uniref:Uncharacterized protein n=1 Tax=Anguilla anguilla TaxID=7936 RepID=A0A0E9PU71_ANGAN
MSGSSFFFFLG